MIRISRGAAIVMSMLLGLSTAQAGSISTFGAGSEGWTVVDLPSALGNPPPILGSFGVTFSATGGHPGGYIQRTDPTDTWFWFSAPASFLGDQSSAFGDVLAFDLQTSGNDGLAYPAAILVGDGTALYFPALPPATTWTSYSLPLGSVGWRVGDYLSGPSPTAEQMQAVLGNLTALYLNGDWLTGTEITGVDNVRLGPVVTAVSEPGSLLIVGFIALGLLGFASRRRGLPQRM